MDCFRFLTVLRRLFGRNASGDACMVVVRSRDGGGRGGTSWRGTLCCPWNDGAAWNDGATWNIAVRTGLIRCAPGPLVRTAKVFRHSRAHESPFYARDHRRAHGMRSRCERESPHGTEVKRGNAQEVPGPGVVVDGRRDRHGGGPGRRWQWQWLKTKYRPSHLRPCAAHFPL